MNEKNVINILKDIKYPTTLALVDNIYTGLGSYVPSYGSLKLIDMSHREGARTYERTVSFLFSYIAYKHNCSIKIEHSFGGALFGEIIKGKLDLKKVKNEMLKIINDNVRIVETRVSKIEAMNIFKKEGSLEDFNTVKYLSKEFIPIYCLNNYMRYFAGPLLPSTGFIKIFHIKELDNGFLIILPSSEDPFKLSKIEKRTKLLSTYNESNQWAEILGIGNVGELNDAIVSNRISDIIKVAESFHEKKIAYIADEITKRKSKIILIAGPSSSGKTTFSKRLGVHLRVNGIKPKVIGLDDYFVDRDKTPRDETGAYYFDSIKALDLDLFNKHLTSLIKGEEIEVPTFNFKKGIREWNGNKMKLEKDEVIIIEGLHSLNPLLTESIKEELKFKIYVSALTQLNINSLNRIPTRDVRLIRRIFRDTLFRGNPPSVTLARWKSVIKGEEEHIFKFQENADVMFNSSLVYELAVLKNYVETPLRSITYDDEYYCEALRLLNFLNHFLPISEDEIPPTSILREFIGGSSFRY